MKLLQEKKINSNNDDVFVDYLNQLWESALNNEMKAIFFDVSENKFNSYLNRYVDYFNEEILFIREQVKENEFNFPYFPFLNYIKKFLGGKDEKTINQYLDKAGVYYFQRTIFKTFLTDEAIKRNEEILLEELDYEKKQIYDSILKLFAEISREQPILMVVENLHYIGESSLNLIKHMLNNKYQGKVMLVFTFEQQKSFLINQVQEGYWEDFIEKLEFNATVISLEKNTNYKSTPTNTAVNSYELEELINLSNNCLKFLALKEAKNYIFKVYEQYKKDKTQLDKKYYSKMFDLLGDIHNYLAEDDKALVYYQMLVNYLQGEDNPIKLADAYRKNAIVNLKKYNIEIAKKLVNQSLKLAREFEADNLIFKAYFTICLIQEKCGSYREKQWEALYKKLMEFGEKLGAYNTLARCYIYYNQEEMSEYYKKGLKIAKKYNNEYRLSVAYHTRAAMYIIDKDYDKVLKYYKKTEKIRKKINSETSLARIYNGLGYYYFLMEEYEKSYNYNNKSLYYSREVKDYHEIGMTCFNLGFMLFLACKYDKAIFYLNKILDIFRVLQLDRLSFHSKPKIYSLIAINHLKKGNIDKAQEYMFRIKLHDFEDQNLAEENTDNFEKFFLNFFKALFFKREENYIEAKNYFKQALNFLKQVKTTNEHVLPRFYYEYGLLHKKFNEKQKMKKIFKKGLKACEKLNYSFCKNLILTEMKLEQENKINRFSFKDSSFDFDWIAESAKLEETMNKLYSQIDRVKFLNNLQNILVSSSEKSVLIKEVMNLINHNFLAEEIYLMLKEKGRWEDYFNDSNDNKQILKSQAEIKRFIKYIAADNEEKIIYSTEGDNPYRELIGRFTSMIFIPLKADKEIIGGLLCLTLSEEIKLTKDDLDILSIAFKQLSITLERIKAYKQVLASSRTDFLTGLSNRNELVRNLDSEVKRLKRYKNQSLRGYSVIFIDLDNFKYYNDRFGHNIGDLLLRRFADLLNENFREVDIVARFGGDEFVIALPETESAGAFIAAERVQNNLKARRQFQKDIEEKLDGKIKIPEEKKLTCSIGIAEYDKNNCKDKDDLLNKADKALYEAKESGKNQIIIWENNA